MNSTAVEIALEDALDGVRLLEHRFYKRWESGELSLSELTSYASQYRHFEAALPEILRSISAQLEEGDAKKFVEANLADETGDPTHLALFDQFAASVDADIEEAPSPAMAKLLSNYGVAMSEGPAAALAGLAAYEMQSAGVASTKGEGLRSHYGIDEKGSLFWDLHSELDVTHRQWAIEALAAVATDETQVREGARSVAQAWWEFLDEREELAAAHAG